MVKEGLAAVVNEAHGTGGMARLYEVKVAGKTGTSQVIKLRDSQGNVPYQFRDHALFVGFAPFEKPEVAVGVVVEHGEHWRKCCSAYCRAYSAHLFRGKRGDKKTGDSRGCQ